MRPCGGATCSVLPADCSPAATHVRFSFLFLVPADRCSSLQVHRTPPPLAGKPRGGLSPFFHDAAPFLLINVWHDTAAAWCVFSSADHSLLSDPCPFVSCCPRLILSPSPCCPIAMHCPIATRRPFVASPSPRCLHCIALSCRPLAMQSPLCHTLPLSGRPSPYVALLPRVTLVMLHADLWGKWRGSSEWVGEWNASTGSSVV
jgi:hypothetical protein